MSVINYISSLEKMMPTRKQICFLITFKFKEQQKFKDQRVFTNRRDYNFAVNYWIDKGILGKSGSTVILTVRWFPQFLYNWLVKYEKIF